jgi:TIR domain/ATPase family associated with various cellular activities (AAA)
MNLPKTYTLEEVFNEARYPEVTFVPPREYLQIKSAFRAEGKHITLSGPSGSGKTTLVNHLIQEEKVARTDVLELSGREYNNLESGLLVLAERLSTAPNLEEITALLQLVKFVLIDDFHHLSKGARLEIGQLLKLWHERRVRFIIVGIASSADELFGADTELGIRNDPFELKTQDEQFVRTLVKKGEDALNVDFSDSLENEIIEACNGVPSIAHVICRILCAEASIDRTVQGERKPIHFRLRDQAGSVLRIFKAKYFDKVVGLAKGKQQSRSVHNTYFDIIATIAADSRSEIPVEFLFRKIVGPISDSKQRNRKSTSFYNCLNNLGEVIADKGMGDVLFYRAGAKYISIEDPSLRFYLNLFDIEDVRKRVHIRRHDYTYDVAVSFAGEVRDKVLDVIKEVQKRDLHVFYDFDQQALLWGKDLRKLLASIYSEEAVFMMIFLSKDYPEKDWPTFEMEIGKAASHKRTQDYLLPVVVDDDIAIVGLPSTIGYLDLRKVTPAEVADLLAKKLDALEVASSGGSDRRDEPAREPARSVDKTS